MKNKERIAELFDFLTANHEAVDQSIWVHTSSDVGGDEDLQDLLSCGTTACAAGWTVLLAGIPLSDAHLGSEDDGVGLYWESARVRVPVPPAMLGSRSISYVAAGLLGLDYDEVETLFYDCETVEDVLLQLKRWL